MDIFAVKTCEDENEIVYQVYEGADEIASLYLLKENGTGDDIAGFEDIDLTLQSFKVAEEYRGRRIGEKLLFYALNRLPTYKRVYLVPDDVSKKFDSGQKLPTYYRKLGFRGKTLENCEYMWCDIKTILKNNVENK